MNLQKYCSFTTIVLIALFLLTQCKNSHNTNKNTDGNTADSTNNTLQNTQNKFEGELPLLEGRWRAVLNITDNEELPFNFDVIKKDPANQRIEIINATERIAITDISVLGDSITINLPVFNSAIKGKINDKRIIGAWYNYAKGKDYEVPFYAIFGDSTRFINNNVDTPEVNITGKWDIMFVSDNKKEKLDAVGEFVQQGMRVTGTFLTTTGDYRFLEGSIVDNQLFMSCFDGAHAFLFKADVESANDLKGEFWSGKTWHQIWFGTKNPNASLPDPTTLTRPKKQKQDINFTFPDVNGKAVSLKDGQFVGRPVLLQIMGTWCPNCMDETALITELYKEYNHKDLEIIALAFENSDKLQTAAPFLKKYIQHFDIQYPVLLAGKASKDAANQALPFFDDIKAFPTTVFIDRSGNIRKIYTGFSGPATTTYPQTINELKNTIEQLIKEGV